MAPWQLLFSPGRSAQNVTALGCSAFPREARLRKPFQYPLPVQSEGQAPTLPLGISLSGGTTTSLMPNPTWPLPHGSFPGGFVYWYLPAYSQLKVIFHFLQRQPADFLSPLLPQASPLK